MGSNLIKRTRPPGTADKPPMYVSEGRIMRTTGKNYERPLTCESPRWTTSLGILMFFHRNYCFNAFYFAPFELLFLLRIIMFSVWTNGFWMDSGVFPVSAIVWRMDSAFFPLELLFFFAWILVFFWMNYRNMSQTLQNFRKRNCKTKSEPQGIPEAPDRCCREELKFLVPVCACYLFVTF